MNSSQLCEKVPSDILSYVIKPFLICKCNKCQIDNIVNDVSVDIYMKEYTSVFDDDFYIIKDNAVFFHILCNKCYFNFIQKNFLPISYK